MPNTYVIILFCTYSVILLVYFLFLSCGINWQFYLHWHDLLLKKQLQQLLVGMLQQMIAIRCIQLNKIFTIICKQQILMLLKDRWPDNYCKQL